MNDGIQTDIQDPFKPLDQVTHLDERMDVFVGTLDDFHKCLQEIELLPSIPGPIRQRFETAKNLSLYACFVYPFHQVAEFWGFSALEMALLDRWVSEKGEKQDGHGTARPPSLNKLLKRAHSSGWFNSIADQLRWKRAYHNACMKRHFQAMETLRSQPELDGVEWKDPTDDEVRACLDSSDPIAPLIDSSRRIRNDLAHGSTTLHPNSAATLSQTARLMNALYDTQPEQS